MKRGFTVGLLLLVLVLSATDLGFAEDSYRFVGVHDDYPYLYIDRNGSPSGIIADFLRHFEASEGVEITIELMDLQDVIKHTHVEAPELVYFGSGTHRYKDYLTSSPLFVKRYRIFYRSPAIRDLYGRSADKSRLMTDPIDKLVDRMVDLQGERIERIDNYDEGLDRLDDENVLIAPTFQVLSLADLRNEEAPQRFDETLLLERATLHVRRSTGPLFNDLNLLINESIKDGTMGGFFDRYLTRESEITLSPYLVIFNTVVLLSILALIYSRFQNTKLQQLVGERTRQLDQQMRLNKQISEQKFQDVKNQNDYFISLSHELRTPLNVILSSVQLGEKYLAKNDREKIIHYMSENAQIIKTNSYRLLRVVNNLIDLSKLQNKNYELKIDIVDIVYLIENLSESIAPYLEAKDLTFQLETPEQEYYIEADPFAVDRVFMNLVANAIKFTAPHGHITLKVETFDQEVKVHVIDDGHGIAAKDRERVFDRFTQIHDSVTNKNEGNGLGLFLSRYLVQLHGGTIDLESEVGRGSKFTVTLPKITTYPVKDLQASRRRMEDLHNVHLEFSDIDFG